MTGQSAGESARAWIEVDLGALVRNATTLQQRSGVPLLAMVKADAYGTGAIPVVRALERLEPWGYGVATLEEAHELRQSGIRRPILILTPLLEHDLPGADEIGVTPALHTAQEISSWRATGRPWHLAIDTGMSRAGIRWDRLGELGDALRSNPPEGAFTHFHSAHDSESRAVQEERFDRSIASLPVPPRLVHAENSPALERGGASRWSIARPGVFLYGVDSEAGVAVEPVVSVRARIVDVRDCLPGETVSYDATWTASIPSRIATLAIGYGDGYRRALSNRAHVLIEGRRAPVVGMVTMDMTMVDVTGVPCERGSVATLLGRSGDDLLTLREVAAAGDLSPYELLTSLRGRLPRRYLGAQ